MKRVPIFLRGQYTNLCVSCSIIASFQTEVRVCILTTYFIFSTHTICITTTNFVQFLRSFPWNWVFSPLYDTVRNLDVTRMMHGTLLLHQTMSSLFTIKRKIGTSTISCTIRSLYALWPRWPIFCSSTCCMHEYIHWQLSACSDKKVVSKANVVGACNTLMNLLHKRKEQGTQNPYCPRFTSFLPSWLLSELNEGEEREPNSTKHIPHYKNVQGTRKKYLFFAKQDSGRTRQNS